MKYQSIPAKKTAARTARTRVPAKEREGDGSADRSRDLARELALAKRAARAAGEILRGHWKRGGYTIASKGKDNPVTQADLEADRVLKRMLGEAFPEYGWLSEETADSSDRLTRRRVWIVDPLDGTKEFIKGVPEFCVAIALVEDGDPLLGVTYNPIRREMFWGARGFGCHLNTRRVRVSRTRMLHRAKVLASRSEAARGEWQVFHGRLLVSPTGSVAYKLALVAAGKGDATFTRSPKSEWDIASGAALVTIAGGTIADIRGRKLSFNNRDVKLEGLIADNTLLHKQLLEVAPHPPIAPAQSRR